MRDYYYGVLFYNEESDRIDVQYDNGTTEGGLHCGQTLEVFVNGKWEPTRIEMSDDWYLVGIKGLDSLDSQRVRL